MQCLQLDGSSEDASSLSVEDEVEFVVEEDFKADKRYASGLKLLVQGSQKRELGQVSSDFIYLLQLQLPKKMSCTYNAVLL